MDNVISGRVAFSLWNAYRCVADVKVEVANGEWWMVEDEKVVEMEFDAMDSVSGEMEYQDRLAEAIDELVASHRQILDMGDKIANGATFMEA